MWNTSFTATIFFTFIKPPHHCIRRMWCLKGLFVTPRLLLTLHNFILQRYATISKPLGQNNLTFDEASYLLCLTWSVFHCHICHVKFVIILFLIAVNKWSMKTNSCIDQDLKTWPLAFLASCCATVAPLNAVTQQKDLGFLWSCTLDCGWVCF